MDNNQPANPIGAEVMREALKRAWLEGAADRMAAHENGEGWDVDRRWAASVAASVWNTRLSHSTPGDAEVTRLKAELRAAKALADDHFRNAQSLAARLATPTGRAQAWEPIETAPKGSVVLVTDGRSVYAAEYNLSVYGADYPWVLFDGAFGHQPTGCCDREDARRIEVNGWPEDGPTHWQPLPAAPPAQDQTND